MKQKTVLIESLVCLNDYLSSRSESMSNYVLGKESSSFLLWTKQLTHSDLITKGKRSGSHQGLDKNFLYYLSNEQMKIIEDGSNKTYESAKQSNIGFPDSFYSSIGVPRLQRRIGHQVENHKHVILNEYVDVFLVNDTLEFFTTEYTNQIFDKLGKDRPVKWDNNDLLLDELGFTSIQLTQAIHGLGVSSDVQFQQLRLSMFLNDTISVLFERVSNKKANEKNKLFILLEKNPIFFTLLGKTGELWEKYQTKKLDSEMNSIEINQKVFDRDEKTRADQSRWKDLLAKEMMNYTTHEGEVFCPFTQINADFKILPMLFIASHIKSFKDSNNKEAYDINNGLLLSSNADALFDKHMITIDKDKTLKFSFLLEDNYQLKQKLLLNQPIFNLILNDQRMNYIEEHRRVFEEKEEERKKVY